MTDKDIKDIFQQLVPDDIQKQRVWENINSDKKKHKQSVKSVILAAAVVMGITILSCMGINAATDGKLLAPITNLFKGNEIVANTAGIYSSDTEIYAPEIIYLDKKFLIFETSRGVLVYDRKKQEIIQTIDLQTIGCYYVDHGSDFGDPPTYKTHTLVENDSIIIFNTERVTANSRKPYKNAYKYTIAKNKKEKINSQEISNTDTIAEYYKKWLEQQKNYVDTFDNYTDFLINNGYNGGDSMYSAQSLIWSDDGMKYTSFLTIDSDNSYQLRTSESGKTQLDCEKLSIISEDELREYKKSNKLPKFHYSGDDPVIKAICEYDTNKDGYYMPRGSVWIPAYTECGRVQEGDELLVFGNFWSFVYTKNGNVLEGVSGGASLACYHLKKTENGYSVTDVEYVSDGSEYLDSMKEICKGHPIIYAKMRNASSNMEYLEMYIKDNNLNVGYRDEFTNEIIEVK